MSTDTHNARYLRAHRQRRAAGLAVLAVEIELDRLTAALKTRGILQANEQPDRTELANHLSAIVELWCGEPLPKE